MTVAVIPERDELVKASIYRCHLIGDPGLVLLHQFECPSVYLFSVLFAYLNLFSRKRPVIEKYAVKLGRLQGLGRRSTQ